MYDLVDAILSIGVPAPAPPRLMAGTAVSGAIPQPGGAGEAGRQHARDATPHVPRRGSPAEAAHRHRAVVIATDYLKSFLAG
jgi:hypothetical protein